MIEEQTGSKLSWTYDQQSRIGDHICYISDLRKLRAHYPRWSIRFLPAIIREMTAEWAARRQVCDRPIARTLGVEGMWRGS
jgi:CDP-paratose 2-epimerase